ncbi:cytosolic Fe-S cluster assembly factor NUBP1 isoform X1 [Mauremys mutica]|uniref:cytosolic Fe-S cluster assembly factor NUBP1 isoform X1 n=1 Tax=Mauremys mutica TaxID=74926 RepID=UPI001D141003|nr:cytosolic Fe-S cluster assembly factor NUBP1 isoform X1 [Mauremys mutica]
MSGFVCPKCKGKVVIKANLFCLKYLSPQLLHLTGISSKQAIDPYSDQQYLKEVHYYLVFASLKGFKNIVAYTTQEKLSSQGME